MAYVDGMTVEELLGKITDLQHEEAVWNSVADYLRLFLDQDIGDPKDITLEDCAVPVVPKAAIEQVLEIRVYARLEEIDDELDVIRTTPISTQKKKAPKNGKAPKKAAARGKSRAKKDASKSADERAAAG